MEEKEIINTLMNLGMNTNQAKVYLACFELGEGTIQKIAKKSKVGRTLIYTFINKMVLDGYLSETNKSKTKIYKTVDISIILKRKLEEINDIQNNIEIFKKLKKERTKPKVTFYEGILGIKTVYEDILDTKKDVKSFEDLENLNKYLPTNFFNYFPKERAKREIWLKTISRKSNFAMDFSKKNNELMRTTKFIETLPFDCDINIYDNKVAIFNLKKETQIALLIEDESIAKTMEIIWQKIWDK